MEFNKPNWDDYFLCIAFLTAQRSPDPNTKHGSCITRNNILIGTGYNGSPVGIDDRDIDWTTSEKYKYVSHAEANAIIFSRQNLEGCTLYCTGRSCLDCAKKIIQSGISRVVFSGVKSKMIDLEMQDFVTSLFARTGVQLVEHKHPENLLALLEKTQVYAKQKLTNST